MLDLERCWAIGCSRCANEDISYEEDQEVAHLDLRARGWTRTTGQPGERTYCPDCTKELA